jgi:predicted AAA+ superfamily ATPase
MKIMTRALFPALQRALADQRVIVITGQRRVGKTTAARWLLDQAPTDNKLYLDLERLDQRAVFGESNYDLVLNFLRNRVLDLSRPAYVTLDEIQYAPNVPSIVKYLYDASQTAGQPGIKFILTGVKLLLPEALLQRVAVRPQGRLRDVPAVVQGVSGVSRGVLSAADRLLGHAVRSLRV